MRRAAAGVDEHLVTLLPVPAPELEDYHTLRYALEEKGAGGTLRVIAVTSPVVGDGKTTTAVNLAGVMARRRGARVLLIDADLRRPSVARVLGVTDVGHRGLADALENPDCALLDVTTPMPGANLDVVATSTALRDPFELLRGPRLGQLLQDARQRYDVVVLDTSPLLLVPDSRILQTAVDGVLLVVAAHRTRRKLIAEAITLVDRSRLLGTVFNYDDSPIAGYYGYSGYYGHPSAGGGH
jgi:capsular exopolysaccharide synthesis family protein